VAEFPVQRADWEEAWRMILKKETLSIRQLLVGLKIALDDTVDFEEGKCFPWKPTDLIAGKQLRSAFRAVKAIPPPR
jgi:hypothetical protein